MKLFLKPWRASISFFILFILYIFLVSLNKQTEEFRKVGEWNLYIQGTHPKESLYTKYNDSIVLFTEPYFLRFDDNEIDESKIRIKIIDSLMLNLQRNVIERLEIKKQDTSYTIILNDTLYEDISYMLPNILSPKKIGLVKFNGGFEFFLSEKFRNSKVVIYINHENFSDKQYFSGMCIRRELSLDSLGRYDVLITPQYNYAR